MLVLNQLTKQFHGKTILRDLSLQVRRGEIAVLLGASGVGKSTLLRVLNNLESLDAGQISLDGQPLDLKQVNQKHTVGMVFQHFNLFDHLSVLQNITLALEQVLHKTTAQAREIALGLLQKYDLQDKANLMVSQLSGGQKQRLAIARTLALNPTIICLDEPTSALDPFLTSSVANTIKDLAHRNYIVIVATHDTGLLEKLPCTIYLLEHGQIVESAQSADFWTNRTAYPKISAFVSG